MGIFRAIVLPQSLLMTAGQVEVPESRSVGAELVGREQFRRETLFLSSLRISRSAARLSRRR
jgi:hypothetical protein